eukprot:TRINITY_DN23117_c0_g1_i1.p1 TRINITY_DN23117_c0_g1~~TRINITY_DN23117_c0_g1_i1.p1  ORF type:complete len:2428 (+),score=322.55 TRINITY_DN23117_c0_g1_i1:1168-8451(+)
MPHLLLSTIAHPFGASGDALRGPRPRGNCDVGQCVRFTPFQRPDGRFYAQAVAPLGQPALTTAQLEAEIQRISQEAIATGHFVSTSLILAKLLEATKATNTIELGLGHPASMRCKALFQIEQCEANVIQHVTAFLNARFICTVHDLERFICENMNVAHFEDLRCGELVDCPVVREAFFANDRLIPLSKLPVITTDDVVTALRRLVRQRRGKNIELEEVINLLCEEKRALPEQLGLRMRNWKHYIKLGNAASRQESTLKEKLQKGIEQELQEQVRSEHTRQMRELAAMSAGVADKGNFKDTVLSVAASLAARNFASLISNSLENNAKLLATQSRKVRDVQVIHALAAMWLRGRVAAWLSIFNGVAAPHDPMREPSLLTEELLQIVVQCGGHIHSERLVELLSQIEKAVLLQLGAADWQMLAGTSFLEWMAANEDKPEIQTLFAQNVRSNQRSEIPKAAVDERIVLAADEVADRGVEGLLQLEATLARHFRVPTFEGIGYGSLLFFAERHASTKARESVTRVARVARPSIGAACSSSGESATFQLSTFVKAVRSCHNASVIEPFARRHFGVTDVQDLNAGTLAEVATLDNWSGLVYALPHFFTSEETQFYASTSALGRHVDERDAISALRSAPYLEDLQVHTQWALVFEPTLGKLSDFLHSNPSSEFNAMEVTPGYYVRIPTEPLPEVFKAAAERSDARLCAAHFVGIVAQAPGPHRVPLGLLASHITCALCTDLTRAPAFVLDCLAILPPLLRLATLTWQIFIEPLTEPELLGSLAAVLRVLLEHATATGRRHVLHGIGLAQRRDAWVSDYTAGMSTTPSDLTMDVRADPVLGDDEELAAGDAEVILPGHLTSPGSRSLSAEMAMPVWDRPPSNEPATEPEAAFPSRPDEQLRLPECHATVERIRTERFAVGLDLGAAGDTIRLSQEMLGRALQTVSNELYSSDTHFVLELIQNADDNTYPPGILPSLAFVLNGNDVVSLNNEIGFSAANINALCDVNNSTKKRKLGYIGQKGIGFKSVFRVSDRPEIHSAGYHIRFDRNSGPVGLICPHWVEAVPEVPLLNVHELHRAAWNTRIHLPLNSDAALRQISAQLEEVKPHLLLFLHKLRCIAMQDPAGQAAIMLRRDFGENIVQVIHRNPAGVETVNRWLVARQLLAVPERLLRAGDRLVETEIALALPLGIPRNEALPQQPLFSFLPVRQYGMKFILQANWVLASSREEVDRADPWNLFLLEATPTLFATVLQVLRSVAQAKLLPFSAVEIAGLFYRFIPLPGELLDPFSSLPPKICLALRHERCILTANGEWVLPKQVVACPNPAVRSVVSAEALYSSLGVHYLHPDLSIEPVVLRELGIRPMAWSDMLQLFTAYLSGPGVEPARIAVWLSALRESLPDNARTNLATEPWRQLRQLAFLPLAPQAPVPSHSTVHLTCLDEGLVFFPASAKNPICKYEFTPCLRLLHNDFWSAASTDESAKVMLRGAGVRQLEASNVLDYIVETHSDQAKWQHLPDGILASHLLYLRDNLALWGGTSRGGAAAATVAARAEAVRRAAVVLTTLGPRRPAEQPVHISKAYGNPHCILHMFHAHGMDPKDTGIAATSEIYLALSDDTPDSVAAWTQLFSALHCCPFLHVAPVFNVTSDASTAAAVHAAPDDYVCTEFERVVAIATRNHVVTTREELGRAWQFLTDLLAALAAEWPSYMGFLCRRDGEHTSFLRALRCIAWIPSTEDRLLAPTELYASDLNLLDKHEPMVPLPLDSRFLSAIGVRTAISPVDLLERLCSWSLRPGFSARILHMQRVYMRLGDEAEAAAQQAFSQKALVFVPDSEAMEGTWRERQLPGKFYPAAACAWSDESRVVERLGRAVGQCVLCHYYPNARDFFVGALGVPETVPLQAYVSVLEHLAESHEIKFDRALKDTMSIFRLWHTSVQAGTLAAETIQDALRESSRKRLLPVDGIVGGGWCRLSDRPVVNDCPQLVDSVVLSDFLRGGVPFIHPDIAPFATLWGSGVLQSLSEEVVVQPQEEMMHFESKIEQLVARSFPYLQRYLFHFHPNVLELPRCADMPSQLGKFKIRVLERLVIRFELRGRQSLVTRKSFLFIPKDGTRTLYVDRRAAGHYSNIFATLATWFLDKEPDQKQTGHVMNAIVNALLSEDPERLTNAFEEHGILPLPEGVEVWEPCFTTLSLHALNPIGQADPVPPAPEPVTPPPRKPPAQPRQPGAAPAPVWPPPRPDSVTHTYSLGTGGDAPQVASDRPHNRESSVYHTTENAASSVATNTGPALNIRHADPIPANSTLTLTVPSAFETIRVQVPGEFHPGSPETEAARWGEELVFHHIQRSYPEAKWVNQGGESKLAYDISYVSTETGSVVYIEVKSTTTDTRNLFEISLHELEFAREKGNAYEIWRVYNAGNIAACKVVRIPDPIIHMSKKTLQLCLAI